MTTTPPGWYDDGQGARRWWDGTTWTEHVATLQPAEPADSYPGGYAAGYSGADGGAVLAPAEPPKSKLWILWLALGVILLGAIVALAILLPILVRGVATAGGASGEPTDGTSTAEPTAEPTEEPIEDPDDEAPSPADQQAAVVAVELYNQAWLVDDCDGYFLSTTEAFREAMEITNCESFAIESRYFAGSVDNYVTTIGDVETVGSTIAVSTTETFTSLYDENGNQTEAPVEYEDRYEYIVVRTDDGWAIDDFFAE